MEVRVISDVIMYPHVHELFALRKGYAEAEIDRENSWLDFESKQIWKRCCKKSLDHYNAIPLAETLIAKDK